MTDQQLRAFAVLKAANSGRLKRRYLDVIYGPRAAFLRSVIATTFYGVHRSKSHKDCQYGRLRRALLDAIGAKGDCIAAEDHDFEDRVGRLDVTIGANLQIVVDGVMKEM